MVKRKTPRKRGAERERPMLYMNAATSIAATNAMTATTHGSIFTQRSLGLSTTATNPTKEAKPSIVARLSVTILANSQPASSDMLSAPRS